MSALRAARGGIRRAVAGLVSWWDSARGAVTPTLPAALSANELEDSLQWIDSARVDTWMTRIAPRLSEYELSHVREHAIAPGIRRAIAHRLDSREIARLVAAEHTVQRAAAAESSASAALERCVTSLATLAQRIARNVSTDVTPRVAAVYRRPIAPRAPAPTRLV